MSFCRRAAVAVSALALAASLTACSDDDIDETRDGGTDQPPGAEPIIPDESPSLTQ